MVPDTIHFPLEEKTPLELQPPVVLVRGTGTVSQHVPAHEGQSNMSTWQY
jgi:hypothetical protein